MPPNPHSIVKEGLSALMSSDTFSIEMNDLV
jgi:hypothetical protein